MNRLINRIRLFILSLKTNQVAMARFLDVKVGSGTRIFDCNFGSEPYLIEIGEHCTITGVTFLTHDGTTWHMRDDKGRRFLYKKVVVGDNVFIGVNSTLLPGVRIDDDAIVAAGSVVVKSVPKGTIVAGNPAKIIGKVKEYKQKVLKEFVSEKDFKVNRSKRENITELVVPSHKKYLNE